MYFVFVAAAEYAITNALMRVEARVKRARESVDENDVADSTRLWRKRSDVEADTISKRSTRKELMRGHTTRMDRLLIRTDGQMWVADHHCDTLMRYLFPVAYIGA